MNLRLAINIALWSCILLSSCNKTDPTACFAVENLRIEAEEPYTFDNCSVNASAYQWDFGDGAGSDVSEPTHTYGPEGKYTIKLVASNDGAQDELIRVVNVYKIDLTQGSDDIYSGTYFETYADSTDLNRSYTGAVTLSIVNTKRIKVAFSRGSFEADVVGDEINGYSWSTAENLDPNRIKQMSVSGSYNRLTKTLNFTLIGPDPVFGNINWRIDYTGTPN